MKCPCGEAHSGKNWDVSVQMAERFGEFITVQIADDAGSFRTFRVPRVYIGMHGMRGAEVPGLAEKYGWQEGAADG